MTLRELKNRLVFPEFSYIVYPDKKVCIEVSKEFGSVYSNIFGGILYEYFPYAEYGFEDPYTFTEEWEVCGASGRITYDFDAKGYVKETINGII